MVRAPGVWTVHPIHRARTRYAQNSAPDLDVRRYKACFPGGSDFASADRSVSAPPVADKLRAEGWTNRPLPIVAADGVERASGNGGPAKLNQNAYQSLWQVPLSKDPSLRGSRRAEQRSGQRSARSHPTPAVSSQADDVTSEVVIL